MAVEQIKTRGDRIKELEAEVEQWKRIVVTHVEEIATLRDQLRIVNVQRLDGLERERALREQFDRIATLSDDNPAHAKTACLVAIHEIAVGELRDEQGIREAGDNFERGGRDERTSAGI